MPGEPGGDPVSVEARVGTEHLHDEASPARALEAAVRQAGAKWAELNGGPVVGVSVSSRFDESRDSNLVTFRVVPCLLPTCRWAPVPDWATLDRAAEWEALDDYRPGEVVEFVREVVARRDETLSRATGLGVRCLEVRAGGRLYWMGATEVSPELTTPGDRLIVRAERRDLVRLDLPEWADLSKVEVEELPAGVGDEVEFLTEETADKPEDWDGALCLVVRDRLGGTYWVGVEAVPVSLAPHSWIRLLASPGVYTVEREFQPTTRKVDPAEVAEVLGASEMTPAPRRGGVPAPPPPTVLRLGPGGRELPPESVGGVVRDCDALETFTQDPPSPTWGEKVTGAIVRELGAVLYLVQEDGQGVWVVGFPDPRHESNVPELIRGAEELFAGGRVPSGLVRVWDLATGVGVAYRGREPLEFKVPRLPPSLTLDLTLATWMACPGLPGVAARLTWDKVSGMEGSTWLARGTDVAAPTEYDPTENTDRPPAYLAVVNGGGYFLEPTGTGRGLPLGKEAARVASTLASVEGVEVPTVETDDSEEFPDVPESALLVDVWAFGRALACEDQETATWALWRSGGEIRAGLLLEAPEPTGDPRTGAEFAAWFEIDGWRWLPCGVPPKDESVEFNPYRALVDAFLGAFEPLVEAGRKLLGPPVEAVELGFQPAGFLKVAECDPQDDPIVYCDLDGKVQADLLRAVADRLDGGAGESESESATLRLVADALDERARTAGDQFDRAVDALRGLLRDGGGDTDADAAVEELEERILAKLHKAGVPEFTLGGAARDPRRRTATGAVAWLVAQRNTYRTASRRSAGLDLATGKLPEGAEGVCAGCPRVIQKGEPHTVETESADYRDVLQPGATVEVEGAESKYCALCRPLPPVSEADVLDELIADLDRESEYTNWGEAGRVALGKAAKWARESRAKL